MSIEKLKELRKVYNWNSAELSKHYTAAELDNLLNELRDDPNNINENKGGSDCFSHNAKTRKKMDAIKWAVYHIHKKQEQEKQQQAQEQETIEKRIEELRRKREKLEHKRDKLIAKRREKKQDLKKIN